LGWREKIKVALFIALAVTTRFAPYALVIETATVLGYKTYKEGIAKEEFKVSPIIRKIIIITITTFVFMTFLIPNIVPEIKYRTVLDVTTYGLLGLPRGGRYDKIPKGGELMRKTAEELAEEFEVKIISSLEDMVKAHKSSRELQDILVRLILWCTEQAKERAEGRAGADFVKEYYTCLKEVCMALFYASEECLDEIVGNDTLKTGAVPFKKLVKG